LSFAQTSEECDADQVRDKGKKEQTVTEEISTRDLHEQAEEAWKSDDHTAAAVYWVGKAICQRLEELDRVIGNSVDAIRSNVTEIRNEVEKISNKTAPR
jgi:hypothetical protein